MPPNTVTVTGTDRSRLLADLTVRLGRVKVVAGGIIPQADEAALKDAGIAAVFSPKDYDVNAILHAVIGLAEK